MLHIAASTTYQQSRAGKLISNLLKVFEKPSMKNKIDKHNGLKKGWCQSI